MKKFILAIIVLALYSLSFAENPSTNHQSETAAKARTFTVLHVFNGGMKDGANPEGPVIQDASGNLYGTTFTGGVFDEGTVYELNTAGHLRVLFSFSEGVTGGFPQGGLVLDKSGNLYGTVIGGPAGSGVLFRLTKDGTLENLHIFTSGQNSEAAVPEGSVIMDAAGNLYGATVFGRQGFGTIYQVDPTGNFTVLHDFQGKADGVTPQGPLVQDANGNLYGVALQGGKNNLGTVFKLAKNGQFTVLHSFAGGREGSGPQGGLLIDDAGNLFGSAVNGGDSGNGTVFEITKNGKFKSLYSFTGGLDGKNPNGELIQDAAGNIYGTTQSGPGLDALGSVFKLNRAHKLTVLHSFKGGRDGASPDLAGLLRDSAGNLYGTTVRNGLIRRVQGGGIFKITP